MKIRLKNNLGFFIIFTAAILLFLWKLIAMKSLFIKGDNLVQFYPWFNVYSEAIKHLTFPFWTRCMQSGFPLMAEGQVGGYYPFNIIFFLTLPFNIAYNYSIIFHFIIAGVCMYFLSRILGTCEWGGSLAALIFCFGSAYAGCFYNIITLRTLSWTPLVFLLFELFFEKRKIVFIIAAGIVYGMQLLSGFAQVAFYCWIFYLMYFLYRAEAWKDRAYFIIFSLISFTLFMPQLLLTSDLALFSSRSGADLEFALWGSFNPLNIMGAVFPYWPRFSRSDFYLSIFGVLFLISSFYLLKSEKKTRAIFLIFIISFLLAVGRYNPLYVLTLKLGKLYIFRNPSKFLFFTAFAGSVLIGRGFSEFMKLGFRQTGALRIYSAVLCLCGLVFLISKAVFTVFKDAIIKLGERYVSTFVFGTGIHRYDLATYLRKAHDFYSLMVEGTSFNNIFNIASWLLVIIALTISGAIIRKRGLRGSLYIKIFVICAIIADLFIYSFIGKGFRGNLDGFDKLNPTHKAIFNYIKGDKDIFRVLPYGIGQKDRLPAWIMPNANMIYKIDSVACYTPLANEYYRKALSGLEIVDNSLGVTPPKINSIDETIVLLRLLNVKYVISTEELNNSYLEFLLEENGARLYRLTGNLQRAFVLRRRDIESVDGNLKVKVIEYNSGKAVFKIDMPYDGILAFSENNYPGWEAFDNGKPIEIRAFSLIQSVELNKGEHVVRFIYNPYNIVKKQG